MKCSDSLHVETTDIDPTGGDPWMGGPVLITVCVACGQQVESSPDALEYAEAVRREWETGSAKQATVWPPRSHLTWLKRWRKED